MARVKTKKILRLLETIILIVTSFAGALHGSSWAQTGGAMP